MSEKKEARRKIVSYLKKHGHADTADLMMELGIPIDTILEVVADLKREGKVKGSAPQGDRP